MSDETSGGGRHESSGWDIDRYRIRPHENEGGETEETFRPVPGRERPANPTYTADGFSLFWLAFGTSLLSIVTVGIYRFWMITRLRRHYWSGIQIAGDPLEYTGRGIEKLLGFLLVIVFLAMYLGLVNLGLTFAGLTLAGNEPEQLQLAFSLSIFATVPLVYIAQYRAMRYMLSRTRWRGIRFGMEGGSWGYMVRAILLSILTVVTFGLAYPYQQFKLAQYMTNRSWFGTMKFEQEGSWLELFASWIWIYIMLAFIGVAIWTMSTATTNTDGTSRIIAFIIFFVGMVALYLTFIRYRFNAFKILWSNRRLGAVKFESNLDAADAVKVYITGSMAVSLIASLIVSFVAILLGIVLAGFFSGADSAGIDFGDPGSLGDGKLEDMLLMLLSNWHVVAGIVGIYLFTIALIFALSQVFFTHRILYRQVSTMTISNVRALTMSQQRAEDSAIEAGGFADALGVDVGLGF